ncbi:MAG: hypothetical protein IAF38_03100 [Bacteroidia bacterium]|nr:hypothetical protein [Bacteroidia bacterium]
MIQRKHKISATFIFFSFSLLFLFFYSCKKDDPNSNVKNWGTVYAPQDIKDLSYFKPGTYWIYKDSLSGQIDSVYVTDIAEGMEEVTADMNKGYTGNFEHFTIMMKSSLDTFNYFNYFHGYYIIYGNYYPVFRYKSSAAAGIGKTILLTRSFQAGATFTNDNTGQTICKGFFPSVICGDSTYQNVLKMKDTKNITENNDSTYYYHVASKGIVKKQLLGQNKNWVLVRYNIIQ